MSNPVPLSQLTQAVENLAWEIAQAEADKVVPYLQDDELTVDRFYEKNKDKMSKSEARSILERMCQPDGPLEKQERRHKGKGSARVVVYLVKERK